MSSAPLSALACVDRVIECDNGRDQAGYRALLHDDYEAFVHGQPTSTDPDSEAASLAEWWRAASDVHLEKLEAWEERGVVTLRYTLTGTNDGPFYGQPATGKRFHVENCTLLQVVDGQVRRAWRYSDTLGLLTQLGLLPGAAT